MNRNKYYLLEKLTFHVVYVSLVRYHQALPRFPLYNVNSILRPHC